MGARGTKSAASLAVVPFGSPPRPEPPADLPKAAAEEWRAIVGALPPEWFTKPGLPLLRSYCERIVRAREIAKLIESFDLEWLADPDGLARYDKLLAIADREDKALISLATRMRLTQQSRYVPTKAAVHGRSAGTTPWQSIK